MMQITVGVYFSQLMFLTLNHFLTNVLTSFDLHLLVNVCVFYGRMRL